MKKIRCSPMVAAIALLACTPVSSRAEIVTAFTKRSQNGTMLKVLRESSLVTLPPIEVRAWTNKDGSVSRLLPRPQDTNVADIVTYHDGIVETNGTTRRAPGPYRRDVFFVTEESDGVATTNRTLQLDEVCASFQQPRNLVDLEYEPPTAVYLYEPGRQSGQHTEPGLQVAVVCSSPTNAALVTTAYSNLVEPSIGGFGMVTAAHIAGSYSKGTLAVESTFILSRYLFTRTNRFINGRWIATESKPVPFVAQESPPGQSPSIPPCADWGPLTNDIHLSITLTNPAIAPGKPAAVHCRVQNSSTNIIVLDYELGPRVGTILWLTSSSGAVRNMTPAPDDAPALTELSVLPGQVCDWNLSLLIDAVTPPGEYKLKATRRMFLFVSATSGTACDFESNLLTLEVAR